MRPSPLSFEQLLGDLERLAALGLFPGALQRQVLKTCRATLEETRAWTNFELVEVLQQREEQDWVNFARVRQRAEKALQDPGEVSLSTEAPARKSRTRRRK